MELFKLDRIDLEDIQHGETVSVVISAEDLEKATMIANDRAGIEGQIWDRIAKISAKTIGISRLGECLVLRSWHYSED